MLNVDVSEIVLTMSISKKRWRNIAHDVIEPFFASLHTSRTRIKEIDWQQMVLLYFAIVVWTTDTNTLYCALDCDVSVLFVHRVLCVCVCVYWLYVYILYSAMKCAALFVLWLTSGAFDHRFLLLLLRLCNVFLPLYNIYLCTDSLFMCSLFPQSNLNLFMSRLLLIFDRLDSSIAKNSKKTLRHALNCFKNQDPSLHLRQIIYLVECCIFRYHNAANFSYVYRIVFFCVCVLCLSSIFWWTIFGFDTLLSDINGFNHKHFQHIHSCLSLAVDFHDVFTTLCCGSHCSSYVLRIIYFSSSCSPGWFVSLESIMFLRMCFVHSTLWLCFRAAEHFDVFFFCWIWNKSQEK